ncbi:MAG: phosphopantothenoylcysteine decarboxylase [Opitutaceae bacterium]|jgi:phosphopantothenoylcysteine decarboxylase/phosphopantothenate--cysteine ligase
MLKLLLTSGATREPIDAVRFLSNVSTGRTGAALADALAERGHSVTLFRGEGSTSPKRLIDSEIFSSAADLEQLLRQRLATEDYDAVIMSAAVADYRPDTTVAGKIHSDAEELVLHLARTVKILPLIKSFARNQPVVIGFKLTVGACDEARIKAVSAQFEAGGVDAVVHNDLKEIRESPEHPFRLYRSGGKLPEKLLGVSNLVTQLIPFVELRKRTK